MVTMSPLNSVFNRMVTLSRAMDEVMARPGQAPNGSTHYWVPAIDAWETGNAFMVQLDLPGLTPDQVDLSFDRNTLTISGTRPPTIQVPENGDVNVFFAERSHGQFTRSLRFPQYVEGAQIKADYANGVLTITVPKAEAAKPRKIAVTG